MSNELYGGHQYATGYFLDSGAITESTNGTTPATIAAAPTSYALIGYANVPQRTRGLNNSKGFTTGSAIGVYNKRGRVAPSFSLMLRAGSLGLLKYAQRYTDPLNPIPANLSSNGVLPWLGFYTVVPPGAGNAGYTDVWRKCKIGGGSIAVRESTGEGQEIEITLQIEATMRTRLATPLDPDLSALNALETPLFFHDTRTCTLAGVDYLSRLSSLSVQWNHNLERKQQRPHWGDNSPFSRTCRDMLERTFTINGEIGLHKKAAPQLFGEGTGATANAMDWGNLAFGIADVTATKSLQVAVTNLFPSDETDAAVDPATQQSSSIAWAGSDFALTTTP